MRPTQEPTSVDQTALETVFERVLDCVENGREVDVESILNDKPELRPRIAELVQLAQEVSSVQVGSAPITLSGYTVLRQLGRGGMGSVCLARQERAGGRLVALKVLPQTSLLSQNARNRFVHEATTLAHLHHPNIVTVHDVIHEGRVYAYAMEWVEGKSLAQVIDFVACDRAAEESTTNNLATSSDPSVGSVAAFLNAPHGTLGHSTYAVFICRVGVAIARALREVHRVGLVHRDVKPSNILLRRDSTPLLSDFGLVRQPESSVLTQTGDFVGTPAYASPEQLRGDSDQINERSDIYSLGVTLYHALSLQVPYRGRTPIELLSRVEGERCPSLRTLQPSLPRDLETIVAKAMEPDPARRYATADELADDLERLLNLQPIKAKPATLATRMMKAARRNRSHLAAVIIGVALTLAGTGAAFAYYFVLPAWSQQALKQARLALLNPEQGNAIFSSEFLGKQSDTEKTSLKENELRAALNLYRKAMRWSRLTPEVSDEFEILQIVLAGGPKTGTDDGILARPRAAGFLAYLKGDANTAIEHWTRFDLQQEPDDFINAALGQLYDARGEYARAYPRLKEACKAFPNVSFLTQYLADAAVQCSDVEKAQQWVDLARRQPYQDSFKGYERVQADIFAAQGRDEEAIKLYQLQCQLNSPAEARRPNPVAVLHYAHFVESRHRLNEAMDLHIFLEQLIHHDRIHAEFVRAADKWWHSFSGIKQRQIVRESFESNSATSNHLVKVLRLCMRNSKKPLALLHENPASYLQRDVVSLETLAGRMEVNNVERWNALRKLPSVMKDWLAQSWLSPQPTLEGGIAEHCVNAWCKLDAALRRAATSARQTIQANPRTSMRALVLPTLMTVAAVQGPAFAGPIDPYWAERCVTGLAARHWPAMAYDSARGVTVMFGGYYAGAYHNDTWEYDGTAWMLKSTTGPSASHGVAGIAYDSVRGVTVLFGGSDTTSVFHGDTWEWDGTTWTQVSTSGPSPRYGASMAFDSARGVTVLFGGVVGPGGPFSAETWEWDGATWTQRSTTGPSARYAQGMAYDSARGVTVLFGGSDNIQVNSDTWEWDGNQWALRASSGPPARHAINYAMAYDAVLERTVLFGGWDGIANTFGDMWAWDGAAWEEMSGLLPSTRDALGMAYDSGRSRIVLFGGSHAGMELGDTWEFGLIANDADHDLISDSQDTCPTYYNPCQLGPDIGFTGLGDLPGGSNYSRAIAVSADGTTVVGDSFSGNCTSNYVGEPFRWRADTGIVGLGDLPGADFMGVGYGVSADGSVVTGWSSSGNSDGFANTEAYRWTAATGMVALADVSGGSFKSEGDGISNDGDGIAGNVADASGFRAAIWTVQDSWTAFGPTGASSLGISRSGEWVSGRGISSGFRWSLSTGYEDIGDLPGGGTSTLGQRVSDTGVVAGGGSSASGTEAFVWKPTDGMVGLGDLAGGGFGSYANGISVDGSIIVGEGTSANGLEAVMWDDALTMHRVVDVLAANGVAIPCGWILRSANDITENCGVITLVGTATNPNGNTEGWIASYIPGSPPVDPNACDDGNACTTNDTCISGVCTGTPPRLWGDITPADCDSVISGCNVVNLDDILCVLSSFTGNYVCAGGLANADIVPCSGNGIINLDDILGVLNAFTGANQCPCIP